VTRPSAVYSLDGRLAPLIVMGAKLRAHTAARVTSATLSLSSSEATQLSLTFVDNEFDLLRSGLFEPGTPTKAGTRCDYLDLDLEVRAVELVPRGRDNVLTVTARSFGEGRLKRARDVVIRKGISPTEFVALEAKRGGLRFVGQPSAKRRAIARQNNESSWDVCQRLAKELGYVCFESSGVLYFARPTWLVRHTSTIPVRWRGADTDDGVDAIPTCRRSGDDRKNAATLDLQLRGTLGERARPGMAVLLEGVPMFGGRYMVDTVTLPLSEGAPASVAASTPENPKPEPPPKPAPKGKASAGGGSGGGDGGGSSSSGATGARSAAAFVAVALQQAGDNYVWGAHPSSSDANPNAFDCSGLVAWAAGRVGVPFPGTSSSQYAACHKISVEQAIRTRGALLHSDGHIAISLGNGKTIEAANPGVGVVSYNAAGRFTGGGLIPGLRY
jgi:cell wall-associated NlpC family hydrolase